jgi:hypothetical protein
LLAASIPTGPGAATPDPMTRARPASSYARVGGGGASAGSADLVGAFPDPSAIADANDTVPTALVEMGRPGEIMDAGDQLSAGPKALIVDPTVNGNPTASNPLRDQIRTTRR